MKIYVDGHPLFNRWSQGGVGHYTKNLLAATVGRDSKNSYTIWHWNRSKARPIEGSNVAYKSLWYFPLKGFNLLLRHFIAPPFDLLLGAKPDLVLFTNFVRFPMLSKPKSIVVVYDVSFLVAGEHSGARSRHYLTKWVPKSINAADHVVTISENAKREIIEHFQTDPEKISIVYPAVDHDIFKPSTTSQIATLKKKYKLPESYVFFLGTVEPRKNLVGLLNAYAGLSPELQQKFPLVLAGGKGWKDDGIQAKFEELKELPVLQLGYVDEADLPTLYSGASVFVFPSFYEGFGMPPLEAMACGTPVITANNSSLPEVVGDAAILIDAHNTSDISKAIEQVLTNPKKAAEMTARGLKQAHKFNWEKSAEQTLKILNSVGNKS